MGLFSKKEKPSIPKLPELPKLPQLPPSSNLGKFSSFEDDLNKLPKKDDFSKEIHELPSFPTNDFSEKFSQNSIKSAIEGKKNTESYEDLDDFDSEEITNEELNKLELPKMPNPKKTNLNFTKEDNMFSMPEKLNSRTFEKQPNSNEPVFIRIDKFEESLKIFKKTKEKLQELEKLLKQTKELKSKEDEELSSWEEELKKLQSHIEKVDEDIFSKVR